MCNSLDLDGERQSLDLNGERQSLAELINLFIETSLLQLATHTSLGHFEKFLGRKI